MWTSDRQVALASLKHRRYTLSHNELLQFIPRFFEWTKLTNCCFHVSLIMSTLIGFTLPIGNRFNQRWMTLDYMSNSFQVSWLCLLQRYFNLMLCYSSFWKTWIKDQLLGTFPTKDRSSGWFTSTLSIFLNSLHFMDELWGCWC